MDATTAVLGWFRGRDEQEVGRVEISEVISLIEQAKEGDRGAFEELMRSYSGFVYSLAFRMLGRRADAEDVFQETFFRAWNHLRSFRSGGNFTYWIKRIATNLCLDQLKTRKRQHAYENDQVEEVGSWEGEQQYGDEQEQVNQLLAQLPVNHRAAVVLFYLEDQSVEEVALTLKQKPATVKVWLFRARQKMKALLEAGYEL
jgi:RNA polymerase sigma-70 factor (ECF subfamily)